MEQQLDSIEINLQDYESYLKYDRQLAHSTIFNYINRIKDLHRFMQHNLTTTTKEDIRAFLIYSENRKLGKGGIINYITAFRSFFNWLADLIKKDNILSVSFFLSKIIKIKRQRKVPIIPTREEIAKLRKVLESHKKAFSYCSDTIFYKKILREIAAIELLITTGLRSNELRSLKFDDVGMDEKIILIRNGKGDQQRISIFGNSAYKALEEYFKGNNFAADDLIFPYKQGNVLNYILKRWAKRAGINERIHAHSFRHYFVTEAQRLNIRLMAIANQVGHRNLNTTKDYTHYNLGLLRRQLKNCKI